MRILFIQQDVFENYGVMILSSILKYKGHNCNLIVEALEKKPIRSIVDYKPDLICFSIPSARANWMKATAKRIKSILNVPIVVGGPHSTFFPEIIENPAIDIVCVGEGEQAIVELVDNLERGKGITKIKNLWVKKGSKIYKNPIRNLIENLDMIPPADRFLYMKYQYFRDKNTDIVMATRGCPYNCTFCFNKKYNELYRGKGSVVRKHSVSRVISEIKDCMAKKKNVNHLYFYDDTFFLGPKEWFDEFFTRYKQEVGLPFSITMRANLINEDVIRKLKGVGCTTIRMGIESANPYLREKVLKKGITNEQILNASRLIKKYGIMLQVYNIIGVPGETIETALETYELSKKIHPTYAWCSLMQPYPGTEIAEVAKKENLIEKTFNIDSLDNSYFNTLPLNFKDKKQMIALQRMFQAGNAFRIPKYLMRFLIRIPPNMLFDQVFKVNYGLSVKKMDNLSWMNLIKTAYFSRDYFSKK